MNRDLSEEVVRRTWPTDALRFFVDGYILALEDVIKDYKMYEEHGLTGEGFVDTLVENVRAALEQAEDTREVLLDQTKLEFPRTHSDEGSEAL